MDIVNLEGTILGIYKPPGITSHDVVHRIRRTVKIQRVGHAGTLDPFAEGVLVVGIGRSATKQLGEWVKSDKEYIAQIRLGLETDTYDLTGKIIAEKPIPNFSREHIKKLLAEYSGEISQIPPAYSAIKLAGKPLYKYARQNIESLPTIKPRLITISELDLLSMSSEVISIRLVCSSGTYVRSLAHDIGKSIGCGGHLISLVRTRVGNISAEQSISLEEFLKQFSAKRQER